MIQRIQTILLLLAGVALVLLLNDAFQFAVLDQEAEIVTEAAASTAFADGEFTLDDNMILVLAAMGGALLAFLTILLFKNRKLQITLTKIFIFIALIINGLVFYLLYKDLGIVQDNVDAGFTIKTGSFMPVIAIVLGYLALRFIQKDDKLVKSMDRLR